MKRIFIVVPPEDHAKLKATATAEGYTTLSAYVRARLDVSNVEHGKKFEKLEAVS
jgi:hypothetical protein